LVNYDYFLYVGNVLNKETNDQYQE